MPMPPTTNEIVATGLANRKSVAYHIGRVHDVVDVIDAHGNLTDLDEFAFERAGSRSNDEVTNPSPER